MPIGTVSLTFEVDQQILEEDRASHPERDEAGLLRHRYFPMPVTLAVGGVEVYRQNTGIFYMATRGMEVVDGLRNHKKAVLTPPIAGRLVFEVSGNRVDITEVMGEQQATADLSDLKDAWRVFADDVRAFLVGEIPGLRDHRQAGKWFRQSRK